MSNDGLIAVWFSCGAASAVAAKLTIAKYGRQRVRVVNSPVIEEHEDNQRFLRDVQDWLAVKIEFALNPKYPTNSAVDVWEKRKFMSSPYGAPCTVELKKEARRIWETEHKPEWHVLGFTTEEKHRHERFVLTERSNVLPVLIDAGIRKRDCMDMIRAAGIELPAVYKHLEHANCLGCVKANSPSYWNTIRRVWPEVFADRAEQSRRIGVKLVRVRGERVFLDELRTDETGQMDLNFECGIFCEEPATVGGTA